MWRLFGMRIIRGAVAVDAGAGADTHLNSLPVVGPPRRGCGRGEDGRGETVGVHLFRVDFVKEPLCDHVGQAHAQGRCRGWPRSDRESRCAAPPPAVGVLGGKGAGDVGVHAGARVVLCPSRPPPASQAPTSREGIRSKAYWSSSGSRARMSSLSMASMRQVSSIGVLDTGQGKEDGGPGQNDLGDGGDVGPDLAHAVRWATRPPSACPGPRRGILQGPLVGAAGRRCGA